MENEERIGGNEKTIVLNIARSVASKGRDPRKILGSAMYGKRWKLYDEKDIRRMCQEFFRSMDHRFDLDAQAALQENFGESSMDHLPTIAEKERREQCPQVFTSKFSKGPSVEFRRSTLCLRGWGLLTNPTLVHFYYKRVDRLLEQLTCLDVRTSRLNRYSNDQIKRILYREFVEEFRDRASSEDSAWPYLSPGAGNSVVRSSLQPVAPFSHYPNWIYDRHAPAATNVITAATTNIGDSAATRANRPSPPRSLQHHHGRPPMPSPVPPLKKHRRREEDGTDNTASATTPRCWSWSPEVGTMQMEIERLIQKTRTNYK